MIKAIVILHMGAGETAPAQVLVAPIDKGDGTGRPDPVEARVALLSHGPVALRGGRRTATYTYDIADPRQVRAASQRT